MLGICNFLLSNAQLINDALNKKHNEKFLLCNNKGASHVFLYIPR